MNFWVDNIDMEENTNFSEKLEAALSKKRQWFDNDVLPV